VADVLYGFNPNLVATDVNGNVDGSAVLHVFSTYAGDTPFTATKSVDVSSMTAGGSTAGVVTADSLGRLGFYATDFTGTLYLRQGGNSWPVAPTLSLGPDVAAAVSQAASAASVASGASVTASAAASAVSGAASAASAAQTTANTAVTNAATAQAAAAAAMAAAILIPDIDGGLI
jgi:hypothetical protein